jgi:4-hydroxy-tetrahydrodipicolinate reductase
MNPVKIALSGAGGRMGRELALAALSDPAVALVGGVELPESPAVGADIGTLCGRPACGAVVTTDMRAALAKADVLVEFTAPAPTVDHLALAVDLGKAAVVGTTGLSPAQAEQVCAASRHIPIVQAPNMSVGVNVLLRVLPEIAKLLGEGYDLEIVEAHHHGKKDAPSGTALRLAEVIAQALGKDLGKVARHGREGLAQRAPGEIGIHAVRAGGIVGEHHVIFANEGEQVEVVHRAFSRQTFALGAMRAARFVAGRAPGLYDINDVLGS